MAEYKEKERLIQALAECDDHIKKFESVLLNLHNGKVKKNFLFLFSFMEALLLRQQFRFLRLMKMTVP